MAIAVPFPYGKTEPEDELMPPSVETQPSCRAVNAKCPEAFAPDEETSGELP